MAQPDRSARAARHGSTRGALTAGVLAPRALLLASAPFVLADPPGAVFPFRRCRVRQTLFGWEAQLQAFAQALAAAGRAVFFTPAPEIFASLPSFRHIADATGWNEAAEIVHLRFGPACCARVLKTARNALVLAETMPRTPLTPSHHPFARGDRLPAAIERLLLYQPLAAPPLRIDGSAVPCEILPSAFGDADLTAAAGRDPAAETGAAQWLVCSFAEFDAAACDAGEWQVGGNAARSLDWRGARGLRVIARERGEMPPVQIMLPWNLADPASIVPDLVGKFAGAGGLGPGFRLVVFPYNETPETSAKIAAMIAAARLALTPHPSDLRHFFVARIPRLEDALELAEWFEIAWLEAAAPDRLWNEKRLAALGVSVGVIAAPCAGDDTAPCLAPADAEIMLTASDAFGERAFAAATLSPRALAALLANTRARLRSAAAPVRRRA